MGTAYSLPVALSVQPFILRTLTIRTSEGSEIIFTTIFVIMWVGSAVISINARFLGAEM